MPDRRCDRPRGAGRPLLLAPDDPLPLIQEFVGSHPIEESIFAKREQHVHDREREQLVGVDEHPLDTAHASVLVEEASVTQSRPQRLAAFTTVVALGPDLDDVADADAAMPAAGQPSEGEDLVLAQAIDVLAGDAKHCRCLRGGHFLVRPHHDDALSTSDIAEHRTDDLPHLRIVIEARCQSLRSRSNLGIERVEYSRESTN